MTSSSWKVTARKITIWSSAEIIQPHSRMADMVTSLTARAQEGATTKWANCSSRGGCFCCSHQGLLAVDHGLRGSPCTWVYGPPWVYLHVLPPVGGTTGWWEMNKRMSVPRTRRTTQKWVLLTEGEYLLTKNNHTGKSTPVRTKQKNQDATTKGATTLGQKRTQRFNSWEGRDGYLREKTSTGKNKKTLSAEAACPLVYGEDTGMGASLSLVLSASLLFLSNSELSSEFPDFSSVPEVNLDLKEVFNKAWAMSLPPHRSSTYSIELLPGAVVSKDPLSSLSEPEREAIVRKYIQGSLAAAIICSSSSPAGDVGFFCGEGHDPVLLHQTEWVQQHRCEDQVPSTAHLVCIWTSTGSYNFLQAGLEECMPFSSY